MIIAVSERQVARPTYLLPITAYLLPIHLQLATCPPNTQAGNCNGDQKVDAGDLSALVLEIFGGDGANPIEVPGGTFAGSPIGCDANQDQRVDAGDISCTMQIMFNGPDACGSHLNDGLHPNPPNPCPQ